MTELTNTNALTGNPLLMYKADLYALFPFSRGTIVSYIKGMAGELGCPFTWDQWKNKQVIPWKWGEYITKNMGV